MKNQNTGSDFDDFLADEGMFNVCSFDKGFHTEGSQIVLKEQLDLVVLPRKGKLSQPAKEEPD